MNQEITSIALWIVALQAITCTCAPPALVADKTFCFYKRTIALLSFSVLLWLLSTYLNIPLASVTCWVALTLLGVIRFFCYHKDEKKYGSFDIPGFLKRDGIFFLFFFFFLCLRATLPDAARLQRPMDMGLLQYFTRLRDLPPTDPWAAGSPLGYYYFGFFLLSLLHKTSQVPAALGYNLSVATISALICETTFGFLYSISRSRLAAIIGMVFLCLAPSFAFFSAYYLNNEGAVLAMWHSRGVSYVTEYPIFSILFYQLHPHFMALPITICLVGILHQLTKRRYSNVNIAILMTTYSALVMTNLWDGISYAIILVIVGAVLYSGHRRSLTREPSGCSIHLVRFCIAVAIPGALLAPFFFSIRSNLSAALSLSSGVETITSSALMVHFGFPFFFAILAFVTTYTARRFLSYRLSSRECSWMLLLCLPSLIWVSRWRTPEIIPPTIIMCLFVWLLLRNAKALWRYSFIIPLALSAFALFLLLNSVVLIDRMNTVYKLLIPVWFWLGAISVIELTGALRLLCSNGKRLGSISGRLGLVLLCCLCAFLSCHVIVIGREWADRSFIKGAFPTLNATKFLEVSQRSDYLLIEWINAHVQGTPFLLEASGKAMSEAGRISSYTGLPTLLGWPVHAQQKGLSQEESAARERVIDLVYSTNDPQRILIELKKYKIKYIVVGSLERKKYHLLDRAPFDNHPEYFEVKFQKDGTSLYEIKQSRQN